MKTMLFLISGLSALFSFPATEQQFTLEVEMAGLKSAEGYVRLCLMTDQDQFLRDCTKGLIIDLNKNPSGTARFTDLPAGKYAIMAFHDEDGNGELACEGLFGLPSEPYAFSNNPSTLFGPPAYRKCVFTVGEDKRIKLKF